MLFRSGATVPIVNWSYDYSDRSYKVILESGDTATITYGDENITIQETTVTEGDTITNNYTIYYLVDGAGSVTPPCEHDWQETNRTDPTCIRPGSVASACSKCQQVKTEALPVLGHDWQIKQTVTTQYDEEGNLLQQGYTIYQCSACGEQYKDETGAGPPGGGGSGADPGEDKETLWDKLGNWAASVFGGLIGMAEAVPGKILDALISLTDMLMERLKTVVETVLSIFDELPKLFGGFLDFLGAVFPFLPPESTALEPEAVLLAPEPVDLEPETAPSSGGEVVSVEELLDRLAQAEQNTGDTPGTPAEDTGTADDMPVYSETGGVIAIEGMGELLQQLETLEQTADHPMLATSFQDYTVTEGLLLALLLSVFISACVKMLKGGFAWLR